MQADYPVCVMPESEDDYGLPDIEPDVCDVPDVFPVGEETAAVESLCFPVVVTTRPQGGCDPVLPLSKGRGRNGQKTIVAKVVDPDVRSGIFMELEILPVVISTDDVEPMVVLVVALTISRVERPLVVARPVDKVLSGQESNVGLSDVSHGIYMESDLLPVVMSTADVEPMAVPVVALTRSQVQRPLIVSQPVNEGLSE